MTDDTLAAVLDRVLPAVDELPGAGGLGLASAVRGDRLLEGMPDAIERVLGALPPEFAGLEPAAQDEALRAVERAEPAALGLLVTVAYNAYYVNPSVLGRIERLTGYRAGAPQPDGYPIEPFDERLLETVAAKDPFWRRA